MAKAKKLPSGNWRAQVFIGLDENGKRKYKSFTDPDRRKCERMASVFADSRRAISDARTLSSAMAHYIANKEAVLSPSTIREYKTIESRLKTFYASFCDARMAEITSEECQAVINDMVTVRKLSPKTIRNIVCFIGAVMKTGGYTLSEVALPEKKRPDLHIPDTDDVKKILKYVEGTEMEIPCLLAAYGPMRRSEICALTLDDIKENVIHVHHAVVRNSDGKFVEKDSTKTYESDRYIPMEQSIINKIRQKGYVTNIVTPDALTKRFESIVKACGCNGVRFHDLRHWCASYLHAQGVPDQYIMARGGWKTDRVMKSVYRHALESEGARWNQNINGMFKKLME